MARLSSTMVIAIPFLRLRDGTHPLAARPVNPVLLHRTGRSGRHRRWVLYKPGPRPADRFAGQPERASADSLARPGPRLPTLRPCSVKIGEAGPEALPTLSLPIPGGFDVLVFGVTLRAEHPAMRAIHGSADHGWGRAMAAFQGEAERAPPVHWPAARLPTHVARLSSTSPRAAYGVRARVRGSLLVPCSGPAGSAAPPGARRVHGQAPQPHLRGVFGSSASAAAKNRPPPQGPGTNARDGRSHSPPAAASTAQPGRQRNGRR